MDSVPADPAQHAQLLRQQLILAQVRMMELQDERDSAQHDLAAADKQVSTVQTLADTQIDRADHLARTLENLQTEFQHLRHIQHVTNEALNDARARLAAAEANLEAARQEVSRTAQELKQCHGTLDQTRAELDQAGAQASASAARIAELDGELRAMKSSRSWRWTGWLRAIERALGAKQ